FKHEKPLRLGARSSKALRKARSNFDTSKYWLFPFCDIGEFQHLQFVIILSHAPRSSSVPGRFAAFRPELSAPDQFSSWPINVLLRRRIGPGIPPPGRAKHRAIKPFFR